MVVGLDLKFRGVGVVSRTDASNIAWAQSRFVCNLFASLAEFEWGLICGCTHAGLAVDRMRGRVGGRRQGLLEEATRTAIVSERLCHGHQLRMNEIVQRLRIPKATLCECLRHRGVITHRHQKDAGAKPAD